MIMKLNNYTANSFSNYSTSRSKIFYPRNNKDILNVINFAVKKKLKILGIGSSLSWHDTIFNSKNIILNLLKYKKTFIFDKKKGTIVLSSNYKIYEILDKINKSGWTLTSIPGNSKVTIGGCLSNDVHGKDSFKYGNFESSVINLEIVLSNKKIVKCDKRKNPIMLRSILGGLGLIGIVTRVTIKLKKNYRLYETQNFICRDYKEFIKKLYFNNNKYEYIVGWIDFFSKKKNLGRGIVFKSKKYSGIFHKNKKKFNFIKFLTIKIKKIVFSIFYRFKLIRILNLIFYKSFIYKNKIILSNYKEIVYPLDFNGINIKQAVLPDHFLEIQFIIKKSQLPNDLAKFINYCQKLKMESLLTGIKIHKKNNNFLSFSEEGISVNILQTYNSSNKKYVLDNFIKLHKYIVKRKYKIYLCKDFFLNKKDFKHNYSQVDRFFQSKKINDKAGLFSSDFLSRVKK